jgi:hypothetical protein
MRRSWGFAQSIGFGQPSNGISLLASWEQNSIYTQNVIGIFHMAPMSQQVQDAQKGRPARPQ